ncbi:MAG: kynureninase [Planctomycetota bacterium]
MSDDQLAPATLEHARALDAADPLSRFRERFAIPPRPGGDPVRYFCGNSLGLMPRGVPELLAEECEDWARLAVNGHYGARRPWFDYHTRFRDRGARLVGALPSEVCYQSTLTVNLHLLMVSFYRPEGSRRKIIGDTPAFPSDTYALASQIAFHGGDPENDLIQLRPREGEHDLREEDLLRAIDEHGDELALVLVSGVNYYTGQAFDLRTLARAAHDRGACFGVDAAHAAGNLALQLHDDDVDFAAWCSYKYGNAGPGAIAGSFVHERHGRRPELPRFAGWWGNDPATRFQMNEVQRFEPAEGADGWQLSNPPILSMAPLDASLAIFDEATMPALRERSVRLTGYLQERLDRLGDRVEVITPRDPERRGAQLSIRVKGDTRAVRDQLEEAGCVCDFRPPDVIRVAPTPLYNTFEDIHELTRVLGGEGAA